MACVSEQTEMPRTADTPRRRRDVSSQRRSLLDLGFLGLLLVVPLIGAELWLSATNDHYIRRSALVEIGSRFTGNLFTLTFHCDGATPKKAVFRAWDEPEARAFLSSVLPDCEVRTLLTGADVYRSGLWRKN